MVGQNIARTITESLVLNKVLHVPISLPDQKDDYSHEYSL